MLAIISPAKTLDFESELPQHKSSLPRLIEKSAQLIELMRLQSTEDISKLMHLSEKLSLLNFQRYQDWTTKPNKTEGRSAIFAFKGDVYTGLDVDSLSNDELQNSSKSLRMLSGLYGLLRPLDTIMPHRLEMGTRLKNPNGSNLYKFWQEQITELLNQDLTKGGHKFLVNLASQEYFKSIQRKNVCVPIIDLDFLDYKNGKYKTISFYAKKARGMFARFLIQQQPESLDDLKHFTSQGYAFCADESSELKLIFKRNIENK